jgi:hydroxymethylglutaryl-CoA lyase
MKLIECPRDALQGLKDFVPTELKLEYMNQLLKVGFDTLDFGSFVSPKWIPQLADTHEIVKKLDLSSTDTKLLAIVANLRGAKDACVYDEVRYLGFPFSISETFQIKNINATLKESIGRVDDIQRVNDLCNKFNKEMVIYISMAFGNPYGDPWDHDIIFEWVDKLAEMGIKYIALSDTVGVSTTESINSVFTNIVYEYPEIEFGAHFHTTPDTWKEKIQSAYDAGCRRFDGALKGYGGCPMAASKLVGNMPMENMIQEFSGMGINLGLNLDAFAESMEIAGRVFPH